MTTRDTRLPNVGSSTSISKIIPVRISLRIRRYTRSFLIQKDNRRPGFWLDLNIWSLSSKWLTNSNPANKSRIRGTYSSTLILLAYELLSLGYCSYMSDEGLPHSTFIASISDSWFLTSFAGSANPLTSPVQHTHERLFLETSTCVFRGGKPQLENGSSSIRLWNLPKQATTSPPP